MITAGKLLMWVELFKLPRIFNLTGKPLHQEPFEANSHWSRGVSAGCWATLHALSMPFWDLLSLIVFWFGSPPHTFSVNPCISSITQSAILLLAVNLALNLLWESARVKSPRIASESPGLRIHVPFTSFLSSQPQLVPEHLASFPSSAVAKATTAHWC